MRFPSDVFSEFLTLDRKLATYDHSPKYIIQEVGDTYVVSVDLPGVEKKDVNVEIKNGILNVKATRKVDSEKGVFISGDFPTTDITSSFKVPRGIESKNIEAQLTNGVLVLTIQKSEKQLSQTIEVK